MHATFWIKMQEIRSQTEYSLLEHNTENSQNQVRKDYVLRKSIPMELKNKVN